MSEEDNTRQLQRRYKLFGESMREIGVLLMVFVPLDATFQPEKLNLFVIICLALLEIGGWAILLAGVYLESGG